MLLLPTSALLLCIVGAFCQESVRGPGGTTQRPFVPPAKAKVNNRQKTIDADLPNGWGKARQETVNMKAEDDRVEMNLQQNREVGVAGARNGYAQAIAPNRGDDRASGSLFQDGKDGPVKGGFVQSGRQTGFMRNSESGGTKHSNFTSGGAQVDTRQETQRNGQPTYVAKGKGSNRDRDDEFVIDVESQDRNGGKGNMDWNQANGQKKQYGYEERKQGDKVTMVFESKTDRVLNGKQWTCTTQTESESSCVDENGRSSGKTVYTKQGETIIYDSRGAPIARSKTRCQSKEKCVAEVNDGLLAVNIDQNKQYDCFDEANSKYGGPTTHKGSRVRLENTKLTYNSQRESDGGTTFAWPDCFKMEADMTLPPGVEGKCVAWEIVVHVLPMGQYDCTDPGTCPSVGRKCYYCDLCKKREMKILSNTEGNFCDVGPGRQRISETVCPTPEDSEYELCNGFDRHILGNDYYKYNGTLNAELRIWNRGGCQDETRLRQKFEQEKNSPILQPIWKLEYTAAATAAGENALSGQKVPDYKLWQWYREKNQKDQLIGCTKAIVDYSIGGEKLKGGNFLLDQFTQLGSKRQLFSEAQCPQWQKQQEQEYKESAPQSSSGGGSGNIATDLLNRFTGGGGNSGSSGSGGNSGSSGGGIFDRFGSLFGGGRG